MGIGRSTGDTMAAHSVGLTDAPGGGGRAEADGDGARVPVSSRVVAPLSLLLVALSFTLLSPARALVVGLALVPMTALAETDHRAGVIPNRIVVPAIAVVLVAQLAAFPDELVSCLLAALAGAIFMALPLAFNRDAIGIGDVKLALLLGAAFGWSAFAALLLAFVCAFPLALAALMRRGRAARREKIPFAAFALCGAVFVSFAPSVIG